MELKYENSTASATYIACGQNSSAGKIFGLHSDAANIYDIHTNEKVNLIQRLISLALLFLCQEGYPRDGYYRTWV